MSGYRQLHTHIWSDSWFAELEPDLKLLFIYLFSNERASICGLYELPIRTISFETGLDRAAVRQALEVFNAAGKVEYDFATAVVWVKNMPKYQGSSSPKVQARIQADIRAVPDCAINRQFLDTLSIPYGRGSDTSSYSSSIDKFNGEGLPTQKTPAGGEPTPFPPKDADGQKSEMPEQVLPRTPAEAMVHPDVQVYTAVTGGRIPGLSQYQTVIETVRFLRARRKLVDAALRAYLVPYWLAWSSRKRLDGRPYDPGNLTWLVEWALNGSIPSPGVPKSRESARPAVPSPAETRRMLAEKEKLIKQATPMPEELRAKIRALAGQLAGKDAP
jgi:hypothetical protein